MLKEATTHPQRKVRPHLSYQSFFVMFAGAGRHDGDSQGPTLSAHLNSRLHAHPARIPVTNQVIIIMTATTSFMSDPTHATDPVVLLAGWEVSVEKAAFRASLFPSHLSSSPSTRPLSISPTVPRFFAGPWSMS